MIKISWQSVSKVIILFLIILVFSLGNRVPDILPMRSLGMFFSNIFVNSAVAIESLIPNGKIRAIANATTVLIGIDLENGDLEKIKDPQNAGSGVIIAKQDNSAFYNGFNGKGGNNYRVNYYVLTNAHVVDQEDVYGIRVADGEVYKVDDTEEYKQKYPPSIYRFGQNSSGGKGFVGTDLAILKFSSDRDYPIAKIGQSEALEQYAYILISGWPRPESQTEKRVRIAIDANFESRIAADPKGYNIVYTANSEKNMSGGPVFNKEGQLVAIHGNKPEPTGPLLTRGIAIEKFLELQQNEIYQSSFSQTPPLVKISNDENIEAIKFGTENLFSGTNITQEEYAKFVSAPDILKNDPAYKSILSLKNDYGCLQAFSDGTLKPSTFQARAIFYSEFNACADKLSEIISAELTNRVSKESLAEVQTSIELLAAQVKSITVKK